MQRNDFSRQFRAHQRSSDILYNVQEQYGYDIVLQSQLNFRPPTTEEFTLAEKAVKRKKNDCIFSAIGAVVLAVIVVIITKKPIILFVFLAALAFLAFSYYRLLKSEHNVLRGTVIQKRVSVTRTTQNTSSNNSQTSTQKHYYITAAIHECSVVVDRIKCSSTEYRKLNEGSEVLLVNTYGKNISLVEL